MAPAFRESVSRDRRYSYQKQARQLVEVVTELEALPGETQGRTAPSAHPAPSARAHVELGDTGTGSTNLEGGCIILPRDIRRQIALSGDHILEVVW
jgi:hypothetical protein